LFGCPRQAPPAAIAYHRHLRAGRVSGARPGWRFGPRLALWGTIGLQTTFAFATLGRAGLVLCPAYDIDEPDVPWANVAALLEAARTWG
jgi:hypothetical protein